MCIRCLSPSILILFKHLFIPLNQSKQQTTGTYKQVLATWYRYLDYLFLKGTPEQVPPPPPSFFHLNTGADLGYERLWFYKTLSLPSSFNSELISEAEIFLRN